MHSLNSDTHTERHTGARRDSCNISQSLLHTAVQSETIIYDFTHTHTHTQTDRQTDIVTTDWLMAACSDILLITITSVLLYNHFKREM